ncbi:hypothetical protein CHS0354_015943 [Potamilus streckersoni]|uniref:3'-5' exonuclease domain-containing protein n=1 Tax=Potamilus streckersoni TaxID=2493646 RepID=A0AAE0W4N4_9BIVA|nr:hypothetical protein CHS0354_015943 [Potamilus streckersoni]
MIVFFQIIFHAVQHIINQKARKYYVEKSVQTNHRDIDTFQELLKGTLLSSSVKKTARRMSSFDPPESDSDSDEFMLSGPSDESPYHYCWSEGDQLTRGGEQSGIQLKSAEGIQPHPFLDSLPRKASKHLAESNFDESHHFKKSTKDQHGENVTNEFSTTVAKAIQNPANSHVLPVGNPRDFSGKGTQNAAFSSPWVVQALKEKPIQQTEMEMKKILDYVDSIWFDDHKIPDNSKIGQYLTQAFSSSCNPFFLTAYLVLNARDNLKGKTTTLSFFIMKEFDKWYRQNRHHIGDPHQYFVEKLQKRIFMVCVQNHMAMFDMCVRCFDMYQPKDNKFYIEEIRAFMDKKKYNEAAICISKMGLQNHFSMEEVVLPLLLQDKINVLETYVYGNPEQQKVLLQYLDHLCDRGTDLSQVASSVIGLGKVKMEKFQKKPLSKLAVRLMKQYQVPTDLCPNIVNARGVGALRYLLHKKFIERSMGVGSWEDMVRNAVGENEYLKEQLVEQLFCYNEVEEAIRWSMVYKLPDDKIPERVRKARESLASGQGNILPSGGSVEESWDEECFSQTEMDSYYYNLSLPPEAITLVDTRKKCQPCIQAITKPGAVFGIDSEWKPGFTGQIQKVALLQLAVKDHVYLLDIPALEREFNDADWKQLATDIFCRDDVLKLGYGLESDLRMIVRTFPSMLEPLQNMKRVTNLEGLAKQVLDRGGDLFMDEDEDNDKVMQTPAEEEEDNDSAISVGFSKPAVKGLSELVRRCFGKPLCKKEQMSDWEKRPLRQSQIIYAALDAYVLLEVYDHLCSQARQQNLTKVDLEPFISMKWFKPSKNEKRRARARGEKCPQKNKQLPKKLLPLTGPPISPNELQVVVDTMLNGLGRQLRSCGVDVNILDPFAEHEKAIQVCLTERRIILTSGAPYEMIAARVGEDMCYNVTGLSCKDQVVEVLNYFNVRAKVEDIFSRCQVCNGNRYLTLPANLIDIVWKRKEQLQKEDISFSLPTTLSSTSELENMKKPTNSNPHIISKEDINVLRQYGIDLITSTVIETAVPLQVETVPYPIIHKVDLFYCCMACGKVFWKGSHFDRVKEQFSHALSLGEGDASVYDRLKENW